MDGHRLFRYSALAAFALCYVTILLGGNVMASDAGLACPDWPTCHGSLLPPLSGATGVEWSHRLSAFALSVVTIGVLLLAVVAERGRPVLLRLAGAAAGTVVAQALLGGLVVESGLTVGVVLTHFALATILFGLLLLLALLANLTSIPKRWVDWAWKAGEELPPSEQLARRRGRGSGAGDPATVHTPAPHPPPG